MNKTSRQIKQKYRLPQKLNSKATLPTIQPLPSSVSKFPHPIIISNSNININYLLPCQSQRNQLFYQIVQKQSYDKIPHYQTVNVNIHNNETAFGDEQRGTHQQNIFNRTNNRFNNANSNGIDMWALNNNLKQFGETRQVGFYKHNQSQLQKTATIMNKTRTQDIRTVNKMFANNHTAYDINPQRERSQGQLKKLYDPVKKLIPKPKQTIKLSPFGNTLYGTLPIRLTQSQLKKYSKQKQVKKTTSSHKIPFMNDSASTVNPYLKTFINASHLKRENANLHILQLNTHLQEHQRVIQNEEKLQKRKKSNVRRNRFQKIQISQLNIESSLVQNYSKSLNYTPQKQAQNNICQNEEYDQQTQQQKPQLANKKTTSATLQERKRALQHKRLLDRISFQLTNKSTSYLQYFSYSSIPSSKIGFYIDSLNHPDLSQFRDDSQYKSRVRDFKVGEGFSFADDKGKDGKGQKQQKH